MKATRNYLRYIEEKNTPKEYIVRSTNFIGQHQEYKGYLDLNPKQPAEVRQTVVPNGLEDEQIKRYLELQRNRGGYDATCAM